MSAANTTLNSAIAAGFDQLSTRDLMIVAAYEAATGGGGGSSGISSGNYAGGQPNFTPTSTPWLAIDTSNGTLWEYYGGAWH